MRKLILAALTVSALAYAQMQTCIIPSPPKPPRPIRLEVTFSNPDGGCTPCTAVAVAAAAGSKTPSPFALTNAKCNQACLIAEQAVAVDNGWNDGGAP